MRVVQNEQMPSSEIDVARISFDCKSRDDILRILKDLQFVYSDAALCAAICESAEMKCEPVPLIASSLTTPREPARRFICRYCELKTASIATPANSNCELQRFSGAKKHRQAAVNVEPAQPSRRASRIPPA